METLEIYAFLEWMKQTITDNNASYNQIMNEFLSLRNEVQELKKEIKELTEPINGRETSYMEIDDSELKVNGEHFAEVTSFNIEPKKMTPSKKKSVPDQLLEALPEYSSKQIKEISVDLKKKYSKNMNKNEVNTLLRGYYTVPYLTSILKEKRSTIQAALYRLSDEGVINRLKLDDSYKLSPVIFYKIKSDGTNVSKRVGDLEYQFSKSYTNPGFELINHMYIKTKRGKQVPVNAKQLKELCKIIDGKGLTNSLFDDCCKYLKSEDINESYFERIIYHLTKGHFKMVLFKYDSYRSLEVNVKFDVSDENTVRVNGHDTKLTPVEVKRMTDNYPYGYPASKVEEYTRECMMKYPFCRPECIRLILENSEKSDLKRILKKKEDFKMDKREKRIANGIIAG